MREPPQKKRTAIRIILHAHTRIFDCELRILLQSRAVPVPLSLTAAIEASKALPGNIVFTVSSCRNPQALPYCLYFT